MTKRAIILVPGFQKREQLEARDQLVDSIDYYSDGYQVSVSDGVSGSEGFNSVLISATSREDASVVELQVYEAYWGDLVPDWEQESPWARFVRATDLMWYWTLGGLSKAVVGNRIGLPSRTRLAMFIAGISLFAWYLSVLVILLQAIIAMDIKLPVWFTEFLLWLEIDYVAGASKLEGALKLAPVVFILGLLKLGSLENISNISGFIKTYLRDEPLALNQIGIRAKTRKRVLAVLDHVFGKDEEFDEVFVVAHSLGGAIAIDALAEYGKNNSKITLHTWGTALGILVQQEPLIEREIAKFYESNTQIYNWIDVVFARDIMASDAPVPTGYSAVFSPTLKPKTPQGGTFRHKKLHDDYYRCEDAVLPLVGKAIPAPSPLLPDQKDQDEEAGQS